MMKGEGSPRRMVDLKSFADSMAITIPSRYRKKISEKEKKAAESFRKYRTISKEEPSLRFNPICAYFLQSFNILANLCNFKTKAA